jgi:hypothetical protein
MLLSVFRRMDRLLDGFNGGVSEGARPGNPIRPPGPGSMPQTMTYSIGSERTTLVRLAALV